MSKWDEDFVHYKYDPLPDEATHRRKRSRKRHVKSDHKHEYERVSVEARFQLRPDGEWRSTYSTATRCKECGRIADMTLFSREGSQEGMPVYRIDLDEMFSIKSLGEERRVR